MNTFKSLVLGLLLVSSVAHAESITFDSDTPDGRAKAYQVLAQSNTLGNVKRLKGNIDRMAKTNPQVKALAPKLIEDLNQLEAAIR